MLFFKLELIFAVNKSHFVTPYTLSTYSNKTLGLLHDSRDALALMKQIALSRDAGMQMKRLSDQPSPKAKTERNLDHAG